MKYSLLFGKTNKTSLKDEIAINAQLLLRGGFIDKEMSGVYSYLPLGLRVLSKIEQIIREEMDKIGQEVFLPAIAPKEIWQQTKRIDSVDVLFKVVPANDASKMKNDAEYILNCTHEDVITQMVNKFPISYKSLPFALYQIQTKFRNEPRAKSGLLRGREFRMKDLYSFDKSEKDMKIYYEKAKEAYWKVFTRLGLEDLTYVAAASGGDFTTDFSHEFQVKCEAGEDTIYFDPETKEAFNKEVSEKLAKPDKKYEIFKACEVGNIFPLYTKYSDAFGYTYTDEKGVKQPIFMGSYGIGPSRVMGVMVEVFHDARGIQWPKQVAPFDIHLITLGEKHHQKAHELVQALEKEGKEVLWDDREDVSAGEKFADCDLIGIPVRLVISDKTGEKIEMKKRSEEKIELFDLQEVIKNIS
jgi:prolyl-tRNA synthetase